MIGRKAEREILNKLYESGKSEFVAVYGRRRVGKTYLVNETFEGKVTFRHAGLSPIESKNRTSGNTLRQQLQHFYNSLILHGAERGRCPDNWMDAFLMLELFLQERDDGSRQLVFIDELPWLDTPKSGFITALEGFWNTWGASRKNLMLVVCGSATSWMTDKLINNHGGLYGRLTCEMKLRPFTLAECEEYFVSANVMLSRYDIAQAYMITGGIPYYLSYFQHGLSLAQNVDLLFFGASPKLADEFQRLFASVFNNPEMMAAIVRSLSTSSRGCTREEVSKLTGYSTGGTLSNALKALIASDFVVKYVPFGESRRNVHYKLTDSFCMFFIRFVEKSDSLNPEFWLSNVSSQRIATWRGFAFENVCFNHIPQIKAALGISGVSTKQSAWSKRDDDIGGTQVDLIIERKDNVVNMCEIKFYGDAFSVDKQYDMALRHRQSQLAKELSPKTAIHNTLITTFGLKYNEYSGIFSNVITLDALFR